MAEGADGSCAYVLHTAPVIISTYGELIRNCLLHHGATAVGARASLNPSDYAPELIFHNDYQLTTTRTANPHYRIRRGPLKEIGRQCDYFTMVRHPIDRLVSAFFYCHKDHVVGRPTSKWCSGSRNESEGKAFLMEYARTQWKNKALNQMSYSTICRKTFSYFCTEKQEVGRLPSDMSSPEGLVLLQRAKEALSSYKAVGIVEHFALSMDLFNAVLVSPVRNWTADITSNTGKQPNMRQELLTWARSDPDLLRFLAPDIMLYEHAISVFRHQTAAALGTEW